MLSHVLRELRVRTVERPIDDLAHRFVVHPNAVRNWENPKKAPIGYEVLELYQDFYGVPTAVILCAAQLAALICNRQRGELRALAYFLEALAKRALRPARGDEFFNLLRTGAQRDMGLDMENVRRVVNATIETARRIPDFDGKRRLFTNRERLAGYGKAAATRARKRMGLRERRRSHMRDPA
jgi:hypothetical protein